MKTNGKTRPQIDYPCEWQYKLIGESARRVRLAVQEMLAQRNYRITKSHTSSRGTYESINVFVIVKSEQERNLLFRTFKAHPDIRIVM